MSSDTLQASGIDPLAELDGIAEPPIVCAVGVAPLDDGLTAPEPPPRVAVEPPPARASAAFRLPPPVDPFLERQVQQQLAQLAAAPPPEPEEHRKGFVLFQAMPGGLFSAIVHMLIFLVLSVYVANDPTGAKYVSLSVVDSDQDDTDVDEFVEMIVEEPSAAEEVPLEVAPDQAFLDNVVLDPPEIAHPEVIVPEPETAAPELELGIATAEAKPGRDSGFTVGEDARGGLARRGDRRRQALTQGATAESENAVELALQWLVRHQRDDGSWCFNQQLGDHHCPGCPCSAPGPYADALNGSTGMVLLALLGAGHTQLQGQYRDEVAAGLRYLIDQQAPDGSLMDPSGNLYSHGLATLALCEALAMTRDEYGEPQTATPRWGEAAAAANGGSPAVADSPRGRRGGESAPRRWFQREPARLCVRRDRSRHAARVDPGGPAGGDVHRTGSTFRRRLALPAAPGGRHVGGRLAADGAEKRLLGGPEGELQGRGARHAILGHGGGGPHRFLLRLHLRWQAALPGHQYADHRHDADRIAVPDVHRLGAQTARFGTGRGTSEVLGPSRQRHVLLLLRHPSHASLRRLVVGEVEQLHARLSGPVTEPTGLGTGQLDVRGYGSHDEAGRLYCTAMAAMTLEVYYRYASIYSKESVTTGPRR